jgi:hypothetical protein
LDTDRQLLRISPYKYSDAHRLSRIDQGQM